MAKNFKLPSAGSGFSLGELFDLNRIKSDAIAGVTGGGALLALRLAERQDFMDWGTWNWIKAPLKALIGILGGGALEQVQPDMARGLSVALVADATADLGLMAYDAAAAAMNKDTTASLPAPNADSAAGTQGLGNPRVFQLPAARIAGLGDPRVQRQQAGGGFGNPRVETVRRMAGVRG